MKPAVRVEGVARRKNPLVMVLNVGSHADRDAWRDRVRAILNGRVRYARKSLRDPARDPKC